MEVFRSLGKSSESVRGEGSIAMFDYRRVRGSAHHYMCIYIYGISQICKRRELKNIENRHFLVEASVPTSYLAGFMLVGGLGRSVSRDKHGGSTINQQLNSFHHHGGI